MILARSLSCFKIRILRPLIYSESGGWSRLVHAYESLFFLRKSRAQYEPSACSGNHPEYKFLINLLID